MINIYPNISISNLYFVGLIHYWLTKAEEPSKAIIVFQISDFTKGTIFIRLGNIGFNNQSLSWCSPGIIDTDIFILGN